MTKNVKKINIKRILTVGVLSILIFFTIASLYSFAFGKTTRVKINGKVYKDNEYQVYFTPPQINDFSNSLAVNLKVKAGNDFQTLYFEVHNSNIAKLRLDFGEFPGEVDIKSLTLEQSFKKITLSPRNIKAVFSNTSKDIDNLEIKDNLLYINSSKQDPFIYADNIGQLFKNTPYDFVKLWIIFIIAIVLAILMNKGYNNLVMKKVSPKKWAFIAIFIIIICIPTLFNFIGIYAGENTEQRELAQKPVFKLNKDTITSYPKEYENYINDNFGMKNYLVKLNNYINVKFLGVSPMDSVVLGKNGWLYYAKDGKVNMIEDYRGITMFSKEQLEKIKNNLEEQKQWLNSKGIPFVLLIAPNKESIYPEYLPNNIEKVQEENRLDQLLSYLKNNSDIDVIDIRKELINSKSLGLLYYKTDSHWNELGAYFGQRAIMNEVNKYFPNEKSKDLSEFNLLQETSNQGGDLAKMLNLQGQYKEDYVHVVPKTPFKWHISTNTNYVLDQGVVTENDNKALPRLLMFRDSYTINMQPYLSDYFSTAVYQWNHSFDPNLVLQTKPDVVVHEVVERYIFELLAENPNSMKK